MQQRIRVVGIVDKGGEVLVFKRATGRSLEIPKYELPTAKVLFGEQPEEAFGRGFWEYAGVRAEEIVLKDVVTFTYLEGSSQVGNLYIIYGVKIREDSRIEVSGERYSAYKWVKSTELAGFDLNEASSNVLRILGQVAKPATGELRAVANSAIVYVDGGSRGNPGPAGIGYYIVGADGSVLRQGGEFIGYNNSRMAEYFAVKEGLEQAIELGLKQVRIISDSLMVVNQLNGVYKVKNRDLMLVYDDVRKLLGEFEAWDVRHVLRSENTYADHEVNRVIDEWARRTDAAKA